MQVHAKQGGMSLSSGSMLQPLRTCIFDLLKLRRRLEIHADSQVWSARPDSFSAVMEIDLLPVLPIAGCAPSSTSINIILEWLGSRLSPILGCCI